MRPTPHSAGAADDVAPASGCISVNRRLSEYLHRHRSSSSPPPPPSCVTSVAFLDALARYPLPVVSAATACDVAGSAPPQQMHQLSVCSSLQHPLCISSELAASTSASPMQIQRSTASLHNEGRMCFSDPTQSHTANGLAASIHQFWALSSVPAASELQQRPPPWAAFSPFRFCAEPSFHATLQGLTGLDGDTAKDHEPRQHVVMPHSQPTRIVTQPSSPPFHAKGSASPRYPTGEGLHGKRSSVSAFATSSPEAGSISFDAALGAPWTVMDALCHGFAASTRPSPHRRKRARTATAASASPNNAELTDSAHDRPGDSFIRDRAGAISKDGPLPIVTRAAAQSALPTDPSFDATASCLWRASPTTLSDTADLLQSRVSENDDLLGLLLGVGQSASRPPEISGERPCREARLAEAVGVARAGLSSERPGATNASAEGNCDVAVPRTETACGPGSVATPVNSDGLPASCVQSNQLLASSPPTASATMASLPLGQVANVSGEAGFTHGAGDGNNREHVLVSSVRDLRDTCARLGLLNTGSKAILQQRLCLYYASAPPPLRSGADAPLMSLSPDAIGLGSKTPTSRSTGSPPRTVFRYRSPSHPSGSVPPASAAPAVAGPLSGTLGGEGIGAPTMQTDMAAARGDVAAPAATRGVAPGRRERLVPPPTQFFHDLAARKTQPPSKASGTICNAHLPAFLSAMRSQEEELKGEMSRVHWRWLVDFRERASAPRGGGRRQHENMLDVFRRQNVSFTSAMLPAGDFMLCVELSSEEADAMQASGLAATTKASAIVSSDPTAPEGAAPVLSHACSLIVERKTAADLDASVKGTRYTEQRRLLAASPFRLVIWLIEGTDVAGGSGSSFFCGGQRRCRGGGGLESNTQPGCRGSSPTTASPAERARQRVDSACASLGLHGEGWLVVRTRDTTESVQFLKLLATHVARQLASYRLHIRGASATDGVVLTGHPHSAAFEDAAQYSYPQRIGRAVGGDASLGRFGCRISCGDASRTCLSAAVALLQLTPTKASLQSVAALQRHLRAKTAFPRMLMCVRGCSAALASLLSSKYGTLLRFWRELRQRGQEACDADPDIQRLTTAQKKVYVLLTEFLLAKDYF